jgi:CubicO group peptidase (beta-lactamase class C family)
MGVNFMRRRAKALRIGGFVVCMVFAFAGVRASEWQTATPRSMGVDPQALQRLGEVIGRGEFPKTTSVLIVYRDRLIYEGYFADGGAEVLNDTRSATKSITSLAVGAAIRDGKISAVSAPATQFLADLAPLRNDTPLKREITVEDLLTMSSALDCNDDVDASPGNEERMYEQQRWTRWVVDLPTKQDYQRDAAGRGPFSYCTAGAFLLGQIIERAARTPVDRYIEQSIFKPLGISKWEWPRSPSGEVMTGGGLRLRSRDLAKIAWMLVNDGRWAGKSVVPAEWVRAATTAHRRANTDQDYGYLFWQRTYATKCGAISGWYMAGNGGNAVLVLKDLSAAVVVSRKNSNPHGMHQQTVSLLEQYVLPALPCAGVPR